MTDKQKPTSQRQGRCRLLMVAVLLSASIAPASANEVMRIGVVDDQPPCSDVVQKSFRGSAVDIWHEVASRVDLRHQFVPLASPNAAVRAAAEGKVDLVVTCLNITPFRLQEVEFTTPYAEDGLSLLTPRKQKSFIALINNLRSSPIIRDSTVLLFILGLVFSAVLWRTSREFTHRDIVGDTKKHTFYKGWMMLAMGTGIYKMGSAPLSMSIVALNNFSRLVVTSIFVAATTSALLEVSRPADISDNKILKSALDNKVGVDANTVAQAWLDRAADSLLSVEDQLKLILPFENSDTMLNALEQGRVGSILADTATVEVLMKRLQNPGDFEIYGNTFYRTPQAFAVGSTIKPEQLAAINIALGNLKFEGEVDEILARWKPASER
jgi:ABC-type amino acid transport substrate-binding protein